MKQPLPLEADIKLFQLRGTLPLYEWEEQRFIVWSFFMVDGDTARERIEYLIQNSWMQ